MDIDHLPQSVLQFPLDWHSRLIVEEKFENTEDAIRRNFLSLCVELLELEMGNLSSGGKYRTWKFSARITDVETYRALQNALGRIPGVKMII